MDLAEPLGLSKSLTNLSISQRGESADYLLRIKKLSKFIELKTLALECPRLSGRGLLLLPGLSKLNELHPTRIQITAKGAVCVTSEDKDLTSRTFACGTLSSPTIYLIIKEMQCNSVLLRLCRCTLSRYRKPLRPVEDIRKDVIIEYEACRGSILGALHPDLL